MKKKLKGFYLIVSSLFISLLHLPFAFAKTAHFKSWLNAPPGKDSVQLPAEGHSGGSFFSPLRSVYDSLHLDLAGLSRQAFDLAQRGFEQIRNQGSLVNDSVLSIIDFSQPSTRKRLYVIDLKHYRLLFNTLVAHGRNSGKEMARFFSNRPASYKSSLGFYVTRDTYEGNNGYSLRLEGLEKGINDNAERRAIVIHGAGYVDESYIGSQGYIGRSEGCPAIPERVVTPLINTIKQGSCLFIYNPDPQYLHHSQLVNG
ncbi:MAG TPA: murein L,D-transpeptidase catalytic domain family protein [Chitinophagaceae bacterium]|nr:murein L,D-transpeptidase catalytic domain family protein [Chitinophagaceae bacterium]